MTPEEDTMPTPPKPEAAPPPVEAAAPVSAAAAAPVEAAALVAVRWIGSQTVYAPTLNRVIAYGDTFEVTAEQLRDDPNLVAASAPFTPDPAIVAIVEAALPKET